MNFEILNKKRSNTVIRRVLLTGEKFHRLPKTNNNLKRTRKELK